MFRSLQVDLNCKKQCYRSTGDKNDHGVDYVVKGNYNTSLSRSAESSLFFY